MEEKINWTPDSWGVSKMKEEFNVLVELLNSKDLTKEEVEKSEKALVRIDSVCESMMEELYD